MRAVPFKTCANCLDRIETDWAYCPTCGYRQSTHRPSRLGVWLDGLFGRLEDKLKRTRR